MKRLPAIMLLTVFLIASCTREKKVVEESYPDGSPKRVCIYRGNGDDRQLMRETTYYPGKKVKMDGNYKNNQRDGQWTYWYENGTKWSEGFFRDGKNEGRRLTYFENGRIRYEAYYNNGNRVGKWKFYDVKGRLLQVVDYDAPANAGK